MMTEVYRNRFNSDIWWSSGNGDYIRYGCWSEGNLIKGGFCCWKFCGPVKGWFQSFEEAEKALNEQNGAVA
jgi:hypothetical protein